MNIRIRNGRGKTGCVLTANGNLILISAAVRRYYRKNSAFFIAVNLNLKCFAIRSFSPDADIAFISRAAS